MTFATGSDHVCWSLRFDIKAMIHGGGFGTAFLASDGEKEGVLKLAHDQPDANKALQNECDILRRLDAHPGIIHVFSMHISPQHGFLFMEHGGEALIDAMERAQRYDCDSILTQILNAVGHMHKQRVVHCDLKLENITINSSGQVKLIDFGLSTVLGEDGMMVCSAGSGLYAAPELHQRWRPYHGYKVDAWSCGIIAYAIHYRAFPFHKSTSGCPHFAAFEATTRTSPHIDAFAWAYSHCPKLRELAMPSPLVRYVIDNCLRIDPCRRCYIHVPHAPYVPMAIAPALPPPQPFAVVAL